MLVAMKRLFAMLLFCLMATAVQAWQQVNETAPEPAREFRAAWVSTVYNLDWPSRAGLSPAQQRAELLNIIEKARQMRLNAIILQVRPNGDALYNSRYEPWSAWLSGAGVNPGYDPLAFAIDEAHKRGLEVHAWFNPFRATISGRPVGRGHIALKRRDLLKKAGSTMILNPSAPDAQEHVLKVILDVVRRYDIDGVHLDDYFYPYPPNNNIADGKTPAQRRAAINHFVSTLYRDVKDIKPYVRVGISPFGIWQPGYPRQVEAQVNAYEHLACDARLWLQKGWVDYLAPQLYWRISGKQSFTALMQWWSSINPNRPVWPGIASVRIKSKEDPGRTAAEIGAQIAATRRCARQSSGQLFWSWRSLGSNRGGVLSELARYYPEAALPPAMPWCGNTRPGRPAVAAQNVRGGCRITWRPADRSARKWAVQLGRGGRWFLYCVLPSRANAIVLPASVSSRIDRIAIRPISACGNSGAPGVLAR